VHTKMQLNQLTSNTIGAAIDVHRELGPGLLESAYETYLAIELAERDIPFERQKVVPINYKGTEIDNGFRIDLFVDKRVVVELKAVRELAPIHEAQVLTYLKLANCRLGLLLNFNNPQMRDGIKRLILD